ncbi:unnamed protein product [Rhizophagus irregularis]|nr:unnamed protein product [Rhizophagus irregularis]
MGDNGVSWNSLQAIFFSVWPLRNLYREIIMYGHTQGEMTAKNIRETTIYGQGEMINGNNSAKNIREATIYRYIQGEIINKFMPEVQNQPSNSNFDAHYQNYCRCCITHIATLFHKEF